MAAFVKKYSLQIFLFSLVFLFGIAAAWVYGSGMLKEDAGQSDPNADFSIIKQAPDFALENVDGKSVSLADTEGKVRLFYFFFASCPDVCPPTTYMLTEAQDMLKEKGVFGKDVVFHSVSFDPERDSKEVLKKWALEKNKADLSGWYFLRGDEKKTAELMEQFGSLVIKDKDGNFSHSNYVTLVDGEGNIRKVYNVQMDADDVTAETIATGVMKLLES
ncbi:SCO family protein [Paenibacillus agilis]|uniref:SCO family protein n=1 Tax=Paenibacillus agilis TaxID=3020863 RepID=UPI0021BD1BCB|nr:SCO family protein [Paenibacillus agilis]